MRNPQRPQYPHLPYQHPQPACAPHAGTQCPYPRHAKSRTPCSLHSAPRTPSPRCTETQTPCHAHARAQSPCPQYAVSQCPQQHSAVTQGQHPANAGCPAHEESVSFPASLRSKTGTRHAAPHRTIRKVALALMALTMLALAPQPVAPPAALKLSPHRGTLLMPPAALQHSSRRGALPASPPGTLQKTLALLALMKPSDAFAMLSPEEDDPATIKDDLSDKNLHHVADITGGDLPEIRKHGILRVLVTYRKGDFFIADGETRGVAADLAQNFAEWLNKKRPPGTNPVRVIFVPVAFEALISSLKEGKGDLIATGLTITPERAAQVTFTTPYLGNVDEILVTRAGNPAPTSLDDLSGRTVNVLRGSSYEANLKKLNAKFRKQGRKEMRIVPSAPGLQNEDLLAMLDAAAIDLAVSNRFSADMWAKVMKNIRPLHRVVLSKDNKLAWALPPDRPELLAAANAFMTHDAKRVANQGAKLVEKYYSSPQWRSNPLGKRFKARVDKLWPYFKKYGDKYDFDWFLLLSLAFRESRLVQTARSHKGAVGVMQLLPSTASSIGCSKVISNAEANIRCGTYYLDKLRDDYFSSSEIREPNRTLFALAAYNMGPNRLMRVRTKAADMGLDPNEWFGNVEYAALRYVGKEPVQYVVLVSAYYMAYSGAAWQYELRRKLLKEKGIRMPSAFISDADDGDDIHDAIDDGRLSCSAETDDGEGKKQYGEERHAATVGLYLFSGKRMELFATPSR